MQTLATVPEMRKAAQALRAQGRRIALVPTMGALHPGHRALIEAAKQSGAAVVVSIFVNPLQLPSAEAVNYPRTPEADLTLCAEAGVDAVFQPAADELYPRGYSSYVGEEAYSKPLCGISRPAQFRGITTIVAKLINIVHPDAVFVGQKDIQQAAVLRKMIADLHFDAAVVVVPTARDTDGLAHGVHGRMLTTSQRTEAGVLRQAFAKAREMVDAGVRSTDRLVAEVTHIIGQRRRVRVIYVSIVDGATMETEREIVPGRSLLMIAVWVDEVRLIDNLPL
ncbi:MAG TPA: pantoate--beta-alanine ligase [Opitutaceae bacterium]|nr:pantoate--beta-alanine ligase [Opitutaceae bacterium]